MYEKLYRREPDFGLEQKQIESNTIVIAGIAPFSLKKRSPEPTSSDTRRGLRPLSEGTDLVRLKKVVNSAKMIK